MESVYSTKVKAGKRRTYFFDVRQTKGEDYYITLTESTRKFNGDGYNRHKIFLYKEDFNRFLKGLEDAIDHVKTNLMPDFDYELYERRQEEWEAQLEAEKAAEASAEPEESETTSTDDSSASEESTTEEDTSSAPDSEDDISW
jgi:uncharacterized protein with von Willebrand factor type A (vWA) domain